MLMNCVGWGLAVCRFDFGRRGLARLCCRKDGQNEKRRRCIVVPSECEMRKREKERQKKGGPPIRKIVNPRMDSRTSLHRAICNM